MGGIKLDVWYTKGSTKSELNEPPWWTPGSILAYSAWDGGFDHWPNHIRLRIDSHCFYACNIRDIIMAGWHRMMCLSVVACLTAGCCFYEIAQ